MKNWLKPKFILVVFLCFASGGLAWAFWKKARPAGYDFVLVQRGRLTQEVSLTAKVKASESLDLAFQNGGRVARLSFQVGDRVAAGQTMAELNSAEILAQLSQAKANLSASQAQLADLQNGTRPEELALAQTALENAQVSLTDSQKNWLTVSAKAQTDLDTAYSAALAASQKAVSTAKTSLLTLTDIQYNHNVILSNNAVIQSKGLAVQTLLGGADAGQWTTTAIGGLTGGAFGQVQIAMTNPVPANIDLALSRLGAALQQVKTALDSVPILAELTSTEKTNLSTEKSNIAAEITSVDTKTQAVAGQKTTNAYNLSVAQSGVTTSQNALKTAQDNLRLKKAGATAEEIAIQQAKVESSQAALDLIEVQLGRNRVVAPINGVLTRADIKVGEEALAGQNVFSLISDKQYQIEAAVPEVDIAKVKINDRATLTLDAFGPDRVFPAQVIKIDPAEVLVEGVPTYRVVLEFRGDITGVRPGLTADLEILTAQKDDVLFVPQRLISSRNNDKLVRRLGLDNKVTEVKVQTGLRGSNGQIEILSGLSAGDRVVASMK